MIRLGWVGGHFPPPSNRPSPYDTCLDPSSQLLIPSLPVGVSGPRRVHHLARQWAGKGQLTSSGESTPVPGVHLCIVPPGTLTRSVNRPPPR